MKWRNDLRKTKKNEFKAREEKNEQNLLLVNLFVCYFLVNDLVIDVLIVYPELRSENQKAKESKQKATKNIHRAMWDW